ncbi:MAG TPA: hypothetical protein VLA88_06530, partial [Candidatus Saccharimonadales bacterium]|nr:hypothetical protein [Candidatus Saccharimonadales bacterium]
APSQVFVDNEVRAAAKHSAERASDTLASPKPVAQTEVSGGGGSFGGWAQTLKSLTTGKPPGSQDEPKTGQSSSQPYLSPRQTNQEWLFGIGLALGVVCVLLLLINIL